MRPVLVLIADVVDPVKISWFGGVMSPSRWTHSLGRPALTFADWAHDDAPAFGG
ncbi:hypothetical protein [Streptomyces viridochromogenes]|uniref:hypothetical protein n=1 Tax=Streptomyces viridochromogenes TaxID=1938 RepID=UPI000AFE2F30|nr:hypothetical protein [Streptomyces viridochromogenes]